jgi:hypothetical protein
MMRSNEKGIALILVLFMVLVVSTLITSLIFVSQTETWSSQNYKLMSQTRYAAESGVNVAVNHLMFTYVPPGTNAGDPLANYDMTVSPVTYNGQPVVLSNTVAGSNYPINAVRDAFIAATQGALTTDNGNANFSATATLTSMQTIINAYTLTPVALMTWEIDGMGSVSGARSAETEVSAVLERPKSPAYSYAAFATSNGCAALSFNGGATTDSYDSANPGAGPTPTLTADGGNVGTNGNLTGVGNTTQINGSLSTPRSGVGNCTANNVTAQTLNGAAVTDGLVELAQPIGFPTPDPPNPLPPTNNVAFTQAGGCPAGLGAPSCAASAGGATLTPSTVGGTMVLGNVTTNGNADLHLNAGTYIVNSLTMAGNSHIIVDSGPVIFQIAGQDVATPLVITGDGVSNTTYDPTNLQFVYGGTGNIQMAGGSLTSALLYAPNATGAIVGGSDWYGAVILRQLTETGGAAIHYDIQLQNSAFVAGNYGMSAFTWKKF